MYMYRLWKQLIELKSVPAIMLARTCRLIMRYMYVHVVIYIITDHKTYDFKETWTEIYNNPTAQ